jgi:hypothetical protein
MNIESTQIILRQFTEGQLPPGSLIEKVMAELPAEDVARLRKKTADGMLGLELEKMGMVNRFQSSSVEIREFIENVKAVEIAMRRSWVNYKATGEFETASGKTSIEVKKGCYIATYCYGDYDHSNVRLLRSYRDYFLEPSASTRWLCCLYYYVSSRLVRFPRVMLLIGRPSRVMLDFVCDKILR